MTAAAPTPARRRLRVPEVVQTSSMDCGPASLKALLEGFGIRASYGRLREACQIDLDGTSIDTIEEVAVELGLPAEQVMIPFDHLLLPEARALPAMVVVRQPAGLTHFLIAWSVHGRFVQVMDPATGRRWPTRRRFLSEVFVHSMPVPAADWRDWAGTSDHLDPLAARLRELKVPARIRRELVDSALADGGWRSLAALDASTRLVRSLADARGVAGGRQATRLLRSFFARSRDSEAGGEGLVPEPFWSVRPAPPDDAGEPRLHLRGAVLVRVSARPERQPPARDRDRPSPVETPGTGAGAPPDKSPPAPAETREPAGRRLSPELAAALAEPPSRPGRDLLGLLRQGGLWAPFLLTALMGLAAAGVVFEALLFRGFFDVGRDLGLANQRLAGIGVLLGFLAVILLLDLPIAQGVLRLGRHLEARLRLAFLRKIPLLGDRYFSSRLTSDMADRAHKVHRLRMLPELGEGILRALFEMLLTVAGIVWLDPASAPLAAASAAVALGLPLLALPALQEKDLRVREHAGALSRFYLGGLLGLVPLRTHTAERAMRREHENLVVEWAKAHLGRERAIVVLDTVLHLILLILVGWLLLRHVGGGDRSTGVLLLVFWSLNVFALGRILSLLLAHQYPSFRNVALRLMEPLGAPEEAAGVTEDEDQDERLEPGPGGVSFALRRVSVKAGGHAILHDLDLEVPAGSHVAIVGPSGAGKSSLVGILLGWYRASAGEVTVEGEPLAGARLAALRRQTAWVDPAVQVWNRTLLANLHYGADGGPRDVGPVLDQAELLEVLEKLPDGLQTPLGEGGGLVSGGEGQRVRLGRALLRGGARLVILDEPFRGLARDQRRRLLARAREVWQRATLMCVTHDLGDTRSFDRVLVVEGGRVVEDGPPAALAGRTGSRYAAMLAAEEEVHLALWADRGWRRLRVADGRVEEGGGAVG